MKMLQNKKEATLKAASKFDKYLFNCKTKHFFEVVKAVLAYPILLVSGAITLC